MQRTSAARRLISEEKEGKGHLLFDYRNQRACKELRGNVGAHSPTGSVRKIKRKEIKEKIYLVVHIGVTCSTFCNTNEVEKLNNII